MAARAAAGAQAQAPEREIDVVEQRRADRARAPRPGASRAPSATASPERFMKPCGSSTPTSSDSPRRVATRPRPKRAPNRSRVERDRVARGEALGDAKAHVVARPRVARARVAEADDELHPRGGFVAFSRLLALAGLLGPAWRASPAWRRLPSPRRPPRPRPRPRPRPARPRPRPAQPPWLFLERGRHHHRDHREVGIAHQLDALGQHQVAHVDRVADLELRTRRPGSARGSRAAGTRSGARAARGRGCRRCVTPGAVPAHVDRHRHLDRLVEVDGVEVGVQRARAAPDRAGAPSRARRAPWSRRRPRRAGRSAC